MILKKNHDMCVLIQSVEKSKMQESVSEQLDHQLKEALQEAQKFQAELEV